MQKLLLDFDAVSQDNERELLALLQDAQLATMMLFGNNTADALVQRINDSRIKTATRAVLTRLRDRNRLLTCKEIAVPARCEVNHFECLTERSNATIIVGSRSDTADRRTYSLNDYFINGLRELVVRHDFSFVAQECPGNWNARIWRPLFTAARNVMIIDYIAGKNPNDFEPTFKWLTEQLSASSVYTVKPTLYTSSGSDSSAIRNLCRDYGWKLQLRRYGADTDDSLPHDRYVITDRLGLQIGRGFNLCTGDVTTVRDSAIFVCADPASVINKANRAPGYGQS